MCVCVCVRARTRTRESEYCDLAAMDDFDDVCVSESVCVCMCVYVGVCGTWLR